MTPPAEALVDSAAEVRWLEWQARGAATDRRSSLIMGRVLAIAVILAVGGLVARFL